MATIFAWTGALRKRGQLDGLADLAAFADKLEAASLDTIRAGVMTKDLAGLVEGPAPKAVTSEDFLHAIRARWRRKNDQNLRPAACLPGGDFLRILCGLHIVISARCVLN